MFSVVLKNYYYDDYNLKRSVKDLFQVQTLLNMHICYSITLLYVNMTKKITEVAVLTIKYKLASSQI